MHFKTNDKEIENFKKGIEKLNDKMQETIKEKIIEKLEKTSDG